MFYILIVKVRALLAHPVMHVVKVTGSLCRPQCPELYPLVVPSDVGLFAHVERALLLVLITEQ